MYRALPVLFLLLPACRETADDSGKDPLADDTGSVITDTDGDGDGFADDVDCDDGDVTVYPGAAEVCDGIDNNCNGDVDEGLLETWFLDADGDGHGNSVTETEECNAPDGHVAEGGDCDDLDDAVHPDALELCDGIDNDCDGATDESDASDVVTWYLDSDGDGFGVDDTTSAACDGPAGYALLGGDCDDADPAFHPGASESDCTDASDYNCDGSVGFADSDGDGFAACEDCDDTDGAVNEDATETCDSIDNDCDGLVDSDDPDTVGTTLFYGDSDGDGYGGQQYQLDACEAAPGFVANTDDCDDLDATSYPGASEVCDDADNDCDGDVDEGVGATWYQDSDSDGYGNGAVSAISCEAPSEYVGNALDCDDFNAATNPSSYEVCDAVDNDCDGTVDEDAINATNWYVDSDLDGYGSSAGSTTACDAPSGYADNDSDCDDADSAVNPLATELCDTVDNDCDGSVDEGDAADASTWYQDLDGDGFGNAANQEFGCTQPSGYSVDATDCDDTNASTNTAGTEVCDLVDNDCDGTVDEDDATDAQTWYQDSDADGYGTANSTTTACSVPPGFAALNTDCDDSDASANPLATEVCDGVDNNCDGAVDEGQLGTGAACAADSCLAIYTDDNTSVDGNYFINPSGTSIIQVACNMTNGGETLCASLTKGYVPVYMLYEQDSYSFQGRLNSNEDYVYDTDAPAANQASWDASETLNYGQFCRVMGTSGVTQTRLQAKLFNYRNDGASMEPANNTPNATYGYYDAIYEATYSGNLFLQWFTNSSASRTFTQLSGSDSLAVNSNDNTYGGVYITPSVRWTVQKGSPSPTNSPPAPLTHSSTPWSDGTTCSVGTSCCVGCTNSGNTPYSTLPYGQTTILNDTTHSFWSGISNLPEGWSDCTNNGECDYHESGYGVWLFWVK